MVTCGRILTAALAAAALALVALALLSRADVSEATGTAATGTDPRDAFAVLRRDPRPGDTMPPGVRAQLAPVAAEYGADVDRARAAAPAGRGYVWVIPGETSVCLAVPDPVDGFGVNCRDAGGAAAGLLWVALTGGPGQRAGDARVAVLVPDGIDAVTSISSHGDRRELAAERNVAFADVSDSSQVVVVSTVLDVPGTPEALVAG